MRDYAELITALRSCDNGNCEGCPTQVFNVCQGDEVHLYRDAADAIEELLTRKTAFWVDTQPHMDDSNYKKDGMSYYCSNCHHRAGKYKHRTYKFCPWCGAEIVEKGDTNAQQSFIHG